MTDILEQLIETARENYDSGNSMSYFGLPKLLLDAEDEIRSLRTTTKSVNKLTNATLRHAKEKLEIYRDHSDGEYHGGIEHTSLIVMINRTLDVLEEKK